MKRVLCVWLPNWPLQRLWHARPELRDRSVVLYQSTPRGLRVRAASRRAVAQGVCPGMPVAEARGLWAGQQAAGADDASLPHFERHDRSADRQALERLAQRCQQFSPLVGRDESEEALLWDITGCAALFGGETGLVETACRTFHRWQLRVRLGLADTVGAAWAAARYPPADKGWWIIPPGRQAEQLRDLPVAALRLDSSTLSTLAELDIGTLGQFQALPRACLPSRLGVHVLQQWERLQGELAEPIVSTTCAPLAAAEQAFEYPLQHREAVSVTVHSLVAQVLAQLAPRQRGIQRLQVEFQGEAGAGWRCSLGFLQPAVCAAYVTQMVLTRLQQEEFALLWNRIAIRAVATAPLSFRQAGLFVGVEPPVQRHFARFLEQLRTRLGAQRVVAARLWPDAQPEYAFRRHPLLPDESAAASQNAAAGATTGEGNSYFAARPLELKSGPQPIQLLTALAHGSPLRFRWQGQLYRVAHSWGPERIETGWWRGGAIRRDYYRVETDDGQRFWLFRDLPSGAWFLQGVFQ